MYDLLIDVRLRIYRTSSCSCRRRRNVSIISRRKLLWAEMSGVRQRFRQRSHTLRQYEHDVHYDVLNLWLTPSLTIFRRRLKDTPLPIITSSYSDLTSLLTPSASKITELNWSDNIADVDVESAQSSSEVTQRHCRGLHTPRLSSFDRRTARVRGSASNERPYITLHACDRDVGVAIERVGCLLDVPQHATITVRCTHV